MAGGREIKTKIKSVQNTRKVTRALEMVSASKIRKAQELDPLSLLITAIRGWICFLARRFDDAVPYYRRVLAIDANHYVTLWYLGETLVELGVYDEGIAALGREIGTYRRTSSASCTAGSARRRPRSTGSNKPTPRGTRCSATSGPIPNGIDCAQSRGSKRS